MPAAFAACSIPKLPARTITSAILAPDSVAITSSTDNTLSKRVGSLPSQSFKGAKRIRAPLAPPRLSESRNVLALSHAVDTLSLTLRPLAAILAFTASTS